jgi:MoaA/NifB/PqqE/SkfB family radical SAM enzyme
VTVDRFANILFTGPCNQRCPHCIGSTLAARALPENLDVFPVRGLDPFLDAVARAGVRELSLTGTNTDPQLYRHEAALLDLLRRRLPGVRLSLHTNGRLALARMELFNRYDRATVSLPSFEPATVRRMTGRDGVLDLSEILRRASIPVKISTLVTPDNRDEIPDIIRRCRRLGVRRLVLRRLYGAPGSDDFLPGLSPVRMFAGNPVYDLDGTEVTVWDFSRTTLRCLNLFSDGTVSRNYLLEE